MDFGNKLDPLVEEYKEQISKEQTEAFISAVQATNVYDNVLHYHQKVNPFFYDRTGMFWMWKRDECCYEMVDEIDLINDLETNMNLKGKTIASNLKVRYNECFKRIGRENIPKEPPLNWIQFKNNVFDLKTKEIFKATSDYLFTNSIPWDIGKTNETKRMDEIFSDWIGKENINQLYEIIAYCCLRDYPIHLLFCFIGAGRNGKSRFLALLNKFIGAKNCCSSELDCLMDSRFESAKLYKKSVCFMGETNFGIMEKTSLLKKLTGQDSIGGEFKGKQPFDFVNYAKLCISSNSLPTSMDTSEGFFRRWMIIDFHKNFPEGKDILATIPEEEYNNLACKILTILPKLMEQGKFSNQGSIEDRRRDYMMASNPLPIFLHNFCTRDDPEEAVKYSDLYLAYMKYLQHHKKRMVTRKEFKKSLDQEGLGVDRRSVHYESGYYVTGLKLKPDWEKDIMQKMTIMTSFHTSTFPLENQSTENVINVINDTNPETFIKEIKKTDRIFQKCSFCGINDLKGNFSLDDGKIVCEICLENKDVLNQVMRRIKDRPDEIKM